MKRKKLEKHFIMKIGVAFFFALILFFWLFNINNIFVKTKENSASKTTASWAEVQAGLNKIINSTKENIRKREETIKLKENQKSDKLVNDLMTVTPKSEPKTNSEASSSPKQIDKNLLEKTGASCPQWINCMPTIGSQARTCQVPAGCEGITQIAY